tara:strand:+ start:106 stop:1266 length:1161 start_codon:yes stop_codon:yes gene_type:complete
MRRLLSFILLLATAGVLSAATCPLSNTLRGDFASTAIATLSNTSACPSLVGDNACCTQEYLNSIGSQTDPFMTMAKQYLTHIDESEQCMASLRELSCGLCSEFQDSFTLGKTFSGQVRLCDSYCTNLYNNCGGVLFEDSNDGVAELVSEKFSNDPLELCYILFGSGQPLRGVLTENVRNCFSSAQQCTDEDIEGFYTECVDGKRSYVYRYKSSSTCTAGKPLPAPIAGLQCDMACSPGYYLPGGAEACLPCNPGTFSVGGGVSYPFFKTFPSVEEGFDHYVESTNGVDFEHGVRIESADNSGWIHNNTYLASGPGLKDRQNSVMAYTAKFVREGNITFGYKVDGEVCRRCERPAALWILFFLLSPLLFFFFFFSFFFFFFFPPFLM